MESSRAKRVLCCCILLVILIWSIAALSGYAEGYPDIANINPSLYLTENQQFFHRPNGYVLISTNSINKTLAALLDSDGEFDYSCGQKAIVIKFAYQKVALYGDILYIAGDASDIANCVRIERINLSTGEYKMNMITNVNCDFSRGISADANNTLSLVTVPVGGAIEPTTPASRYLFDTQQEGASLLPLTADPASSGSDESSGANSSESNIDSSISSSNVSSSPSSEVTSQPENEPQLPVFCFDGEATIESLQKELDANGLGQKLRVFSADNIESQSDYIGTGQIIQIFLNDKLENQYIAAIPGDLDGTGTVTEKDCELLYTYLTKSSSSASPVLSGVYLEAAKISDDLKIDTARSELLASDLLEIKRLAK